MLSAEAAGGTGGAFVNVAIAVLCLLVAAYPVVRMIGWWIDGGVEPLAAMLCVAMYFVLIAWTMMAPMEVSLAIFGVILVSALVTPFIGQAADSIGNQRIEDERIVAYIQALERDPMDPVARMALAEALYKRGDAEQAIEHMRWTLEQFPRLHGRIQPVLDQWSREAARASEQPPIFCHVCHAENPPNAERCVECGACFGARAGMAQRIRIEGGPKALIRGWLVTSITLCVVLFALLTMPAIIAGPIIIATLLVAVTLFLRWVGGDLGVAESGEPQPPPHP